MGGTVQELYTIRGYYFNKKLGVYQIIDEGLFASSPESAKQEALKFFKSISGGKAKVCNVKMVRSEYIGQGEK